MFDSHIEGDEDPPWPGERRRYRFWREDMIRVPEWRQ
jgi:hypothetical protein